MCGKDYGQDIRQSLRHKHSPLNFHLIQRGNISFPKATKLKNPGIVWDTRQPLLIMINHYKIQYMVNN